MPPKTSQAVVTGRSSRPRAERAAVVGPDDDGIGVLLGPRRPRHCPGVAPLERRMTSAAGSGSALASASRIHVVDLEHGEHTRCRQARQWLARSAPPSRATTPAFHGSGARAGGSRTRSLGVATPARRSASSTRLGSGRRRPPLELGAGRGRGTAASSGERAPARSSSPSRRAGRRASRSSSRAIKLDLEDLRRRGIRSASVSGTGLIAWPVGGAAARRCRPVKVLDPARRGCGTWSLVCSRPCCHRPSCRSSRAPRRSSSAKPTAARYVGSGISPP